MSISTRRGQNQMLLAGVALLAVLPACASDRSAEPTMLAGPVQAEIIKSREPIPTQITGTPMVQLSGTPTVQLAGIPTVQLADKVSSEKWEYTIIESGPNLSHLVEELNQLGRQGWQVVAELPGGRMSTILLLQRRV
jgi:hypothetical protein